MVFTHGDAEGLWNRGGELAKGGGAEHVVGRHLWGCL